METLECNNDKMERISCNGIDSLLHHHLVPSLLLFCELCLYGQGNVWTAPSAPQRHKPFMIMTSWPSFLERSYKDRQVASSNPGRDRE